MASKYDNQWGGEGDATGWTEDSKIKVEKEVERVAEVGAKGDDRGVGRRPMNAFLIFCKRQRSAVRRRYPNLENRAVTRVLGEWWASLSSVEKESYIRLAAQYKEAYMKAHPEFRWNRMPAVTSSPTRLMTTRPKPTRLSTNPELSQEQIVPGKLADESQLGGLSSLLARPSQTSIGASQVPKPPKKRYLEENYSDKDQNTVINGNINRGPIEEEEDDDDDEEEEEEIKVTRKREQVVVKKEKENKAEKAERMRIWRRTLLNNKEGDEEEDEEEEEEEEEEEVNNNKEVVVEEGRGRGRARACKGRRYKEFMWSNLATRRRTRWEMGQDYHGDSHGGRRKLREKREEDGEKKKAKEETTGKRLTREGNRNFKAKEEVANKNIKETVKIKVEFDPESMTQVMSANQPLNVGEIKEEANQNGFNLEERIDALPPLSIEEFHNRKRLRKNVKVSPSPINTSRLKAKKEDQGGTGEECLNNNITSVVDNNNQNMAFCGPQCATVGTGNNGKEEENKAVIGSRKRKLRRQGIRRLEPGSTFKGTSVVEDASPDIIGLATLADVAAKKPRLISK